MHLGGGGSEEGLARYYKGRDREEMVVSSV